MSSIREKVAQVMKQKKVERRNAIEKRNEPKDDQQQHQEVEIGGVSSEASGSDSPIVSKIKEKIIKKPAKKKSSGKKKAAKKA